MSLKERPRRAGCKTQIMGVINVTPDSFFDGGTITGVETAYTRATAMLAEGANLVDIGGESSRPGAEPVPPSIEQSRVLPIVERLRELELRISVDTYHAETAGLALARGASMINDITALRGDPLMAEVVAESGCDCVLMHMQGTPKTMQAAPHYDDVIEDLCRFFEERIDFAVTHGIREQALWLDPGFGFGKTVDHNLTILRRLNEFKRFGLPVLIGTSNKGTIGQVLELPVDERTEGTAATVAIAIANGADAVRVHDVKAMARVAKMADAIVRPRN